MAEIKTQNVFINKKSGEKIKNAKTWFKQIKNVKNVFSIFGLY